MSVKKKVKKDMEENNVTLGILVGRVLAYDDHRPSTNLGHEGVVFVVDKTKAIPL